MRRARSRYGGSFFGCQRGDPPSALTGKVVQRPPHTAHHHPKQQWPASKLKVQVLDDSDCTQTRSLVDARVAEWRARGADVDLIRRTHRQGYKAGALQAGNQLVADKGYQYVAIFDADFRPHPDFLMKTVGYLEANDDVALVQVFEWCY